MGQYVDYLYDDRFVKRIDMSNCSFFFVTVEAVDSENYISIRFKFNDGTGEKLLKLCAVEYIGDPNNPDVHTYIWKYLLPEITDDFLDCLHNNKVFRFSLAKCRSEAEDFHRVSKAAREEE